MQNAHLRLGLLEYHRITEKTSTRIRVRVSSYIGEDEQAHLIGVFGNDSDIGAITAAVHEKACFTLTFPDGAIKEITLGEHASCYRRFGEFAGPETPSAASGDHLRAIAREWRRGPDRPLPLKSRRSLGVADRSFLGCPRCPSGRSTSAGFLKPKAASSRSMA